ncbi:MAG: hypothetical protein AABM30_11765 [Actinomycetota bacterium]
MTTKTMVPSIPTSEELREAESAAYSGWDDVEKIIRRVKMIHEEQIANRPPTRADIGNLFIFAAGIRLTGNQLIDAADAIVERILHFDDVPGLDDV